MAVQSIDSTDKLQSGFRAKYNATANEIWVSATDSGAGVITFTKFNGGTVAVPLTTSFFTKTEISSLLSTFGGPATYDDPGIIEIAELEEVDAGDSETLAIVPFTAKYSTLFQYKGDWDAPLSGNGYSIGNIVYDSGIFYRSIIDENEDDTSVILSWDAVTSGSKYSATKTQANIVGASSPPYILFTNDSAVQIPGNAQYNMELTGPDGIGIDFTSNVQRVSGERRIYNLPEGNFTIVINYI